MSKTKEGIAIIAFLVYIRNMENKNPEYMLLCKMNAAFKGKKPEINENSTVRGFPFMSNSERLLVMPEDGLMGSKLLTSIEDSNLRNNLL